MARFRTGRPAAKLCYRSRPCVLVARASRIPKSLGCVVKRLGPDLPQTLLRSPPPLPPWPLPSSPARPALRSALIPGGLAPRSISRRPGRAPHLEPALLPPRAAPVQLPLPLASPRSPASVSHLPVTQANQRLLLRRLPGGLVADRFGSVGGGPHCWAFCAGRRLGSVGGRSWACQPPAVAAESRVR